MFLEGGKHGGSAMYQASIFCAVSTLNYSCFLTTLKTIEFGRNLRSL